MPSPFRPPKPGTPAYTATADQFDAAQRHATEQAVALFRAGARLLLPTGPWAVRMFGSVQPGALRREACAHLRALAGPVPMYVTAPGTLACTTCATTRPPSRDAPCSMCGRDPATFLPHRPHVAQRGIVIAYAPLCFGCSYREPCPEGP